MTTYNQVPVSGPNNIILPEPTVPSAFSTVADSRKFYHCVMELDIDGQSLVKTVLLDTGANVNLIRAQLIPDHLFAKLRART